MAFRSSLFPPERNSLWRPVSVISNSNVARVLSVSSGSPSLRGGGDVLSRRLLSLRADILARGDVSFRVCLAPSRSVRCRSFREVVVALSVARNLGLTSCKVWTLSTLGGVSVCRSVVEWFLFPSVSFGLGGFSPRVCRPSVSCASSSPSLHSHETGIQAGSCLKRENVPGQRTIKGTKTVQHPLSKRRPVKAPSPWKPSKQKTF